MNLVARSNDVVPIAVKMLSLDLQRAHLLGGHSAAGRILAAVEASPHEQAASIRGVADEVYDRLVRAQWSPAPIHRDEREQPVLNLVPLARSRREVTDADGEAERVGEPLKLVLP